MVHSFGIQSNSLYFPASRNRTGYNTNGTRLSTKNLDLQVSKQLPGKPHVIEENQDNGSSQSNDIKALFARAHTLTGHKALALAGTTEEGLSACIAAERLALFGPNAIKRNHSTSLFVKLLANFVHLMAILLWIGGLVAFVAQMPELGIAIWLVNLLNGLFSFWQEFQAERATEALQKLLPRQASVIRDGREQRVPAEDLTPGDVMVIVAALRHHGLWRVSGVYFFHADLHSCPLRGP